VSRYVAGERSWPMRIGCGSVLPSVPTGCMWFCTRVAHAGFMHVDLALGSKIPEEADKLLLHLAPAGDGRNA
jgi:hypothetical protein